MQLDVNGVRLFVEVVEGISKAAKAKDIVVIHGGPDWDHSYLRSACLPLAQLGRLIFFDLRGCGKSSSPKEAAAYHMDELVKDLIGLLDHFNIAKAILLGYSFGGRVALRTNYLQGDRVKALVLASSTAYEDFYGELEQLSLYKERMVSLQVGLEEIKKSTTLTAAEKARTLAIESLPIDVFDLEKIAAVKETITSVNFSGSWTKLWLSSELPKVNHPDYGESLRKTDTPLLIVHGEKDLRFPSSVAKRLAGTVRHAKFVTLPEAGHLVALEKPKKWCAEIMQFCEKII